MSAFATIGGMFLVKDGKFAAGEDCCCKDSFLLPEGGPNPICVYFNTLNVQSGATWRTSQAVPVCDVVSPPQELCRYDNYRDAVLTGGFNGSVSVGIHFGEFVKTNLQYSAGRQRGGLPTTSRRRLTKNSEVCVRQYNGQISGCVQSSSPNYWDETCINIASIDVLWDCNPTAPWNLGNRYCFSLPYPGGSDTLYVSVPASCCEMDDLPNGCEIEPYGNGWCSFSLWVASNVNVRAVAGSVSTSVSDGKKHITSTGCAGHIVLTTQ